MLNRKQKVEELLEDFKLLKRTSVFHHPNSLDIPHITPAQWGVLMFIEQNKESTVKDVANNLSITSSAATQLINGLVDSSYLTREMSKKDRRTVILSLSKKTKTHVDKMKKDCLRQFLKIFEVLSDKEFSEYILINKKIVERL